MQLIKKNPEKCREVYKLPDRYRKIWNDNRSDWIIEHVVLLNKINPGYVLDFGVNYIDYRIIHGTMANTIPHNNDFCYSVYQFILEDTRRTYPYVHGDWVLSNIILDEDTGKFTLIDWDNIGIYPINQVADKIYSDLASAFGFKRLQIIL